MGRRPKKGPPCLGPPKEAEPLGQGSWSFPGRRPGAWGIISGAEEAWAKEGGAREETGGRVSASARLQAGEGHHPFGKKGRGRMARGGNF